MFLILRFNAFVNMTTPNFEGLRTEYKVNKPESVPNLQTKLLNPLFQKVLQDAFKQNKLEIIETKNRSFNKTELDLKTPLDQAFRDLTLDMLERQVDVVELQEFVKFCIQTCRKGLTTATMPVVLLGDVFDALTLDTCEQMFTFVENEVNMKVCSVLIEVM